MLQLCQQQDIQKGSSVKIKKEKNRSDQPSCDDEQRLFMTLETGLSKPGKSFPRYAKHWEYYFSLFLPVIAAKEINCKFILILQHFGLTDKQNAKGKKKKIKAEHQKDVTHGEFSLSSILIDCHLGVTQWNLIKGWKLCHVKNQNGKILHLYHLLWSCWSIFLELVYKVALKL